MGGWAGFDRVTVCEVVPSVIFKLGLIEQNVGETPAAGPLAA